MVLLKRTTRLFRDFLWKSPIRYQSINRRTLSEGTNNQASKTIQTAKVLDGQTIRIVFSDQNTCDFKNIWLRDSCKCPQCFDQTTKHKLFEFSYHDIKYAVQSLNAESGELKVQWTNCEGSHESKYDSNWLYQFLPFFSHQENDVKVPLNDPCYCGPLPPTDLWDKKQIEKQNLNVSFEDFMEQEQGLFAVLENVHKYGIALIKGVPPMENEVVRVVERMGHIMETGYGKTFQVRINPHPKTHLTYTGKRFEFHTDLAYMRNSPTMQLLHCIKSFTPGPIEEAGGISFFADAFYGIKWLQKYHPHHFEALTTSRVRLTYLDAQRNRWFRHEKPLIGVNESKEVQEFFCTDFSLRPPLLPIEKIVPLYEAYHCLMGKLNTDELMWKFFLKPGDLVVFNNTRVLHGRDEYDPSKIDRHLEGAYMDLQEAMSLYENLYEARSNLKQN